MDVRVVAATNRDLAVMIREGKFREDLYYRLNVAGIDVPPLRARRGDILPLAEHFLEQGVRMINLPPSRLSPEAVERLEEYGWPGNIRELRNVMERALILAGGDPIASSHLPKELLLQDALLLPDDASIDLPPDLTLATVEMRHILRVLRACKGNKTLAAKQLEISRLTLRNKLRQYGFGDGEE